MSGNLELHHDVKEPFVAHEGGISLETPQRKRPIHTEGESPCFSWSCGRKLGALSTGHRHRPQGPVMLPQGKSSHHASCEGFLRIPLPVGTRS